LSGKLYANISHDNGLTFSPTVEIDPSFDPCDCCTTSPVYGADGKLAVLYREETNDERDMYMVCWDQVRSQVSRTRISGSPWKINACPMSAFALRRSGEGYIAIWPTKDQIYFARIDRQCKVMPPGEVRTAGTAGMHTGMLALSASDGTTLVAWKKDDRLNWQIYDPNGKAKGVPESVESRGNGIAGVVDKDDCFVLFQ
jgi:hypothetical protein